MLTVSQLSVEMAGSNAVYVTRTEGVQSQSEMWCATSTATAQFQIQKT